MNMSMSSANTREKLWDGPENERTLTIVALDKLFAVSGVEDEPIRSLHVA